MPATPTKQQLLDKTLAALKKRFPDALPDASPESKRPVLEETIFAICREGVSTAEANAAYDRIRTAFFDWNEIRVSTVQEVADALEPLPGAGDRGKRVVEFLQEHFERTYSFELDDLEKKGLKQAAKQLARYKDKGVSDFAVAWVTQRALGGHAIPLDEPTIRVLRRLAIVDGDLDDLEAARASLEHYIPKARGPEFTEQVMAHAQTICVPGEPHCPDCPLNRDCPTGVARMAALKDAEAKPKPKSR